MARNDISDLLRRPVVVAPMAGGPSTAELVIAAAGAGAVGFLAAGYKTAPAMAAEIAAVRAGTAEPFGVNVFVPGCASATPEAVAAYLESLAGDCEAVGCTLGEATWDEDHFDEKIALLLSDPPSLVSFTFGCPSPEVVAALHEAGSLVAVTVTSAAEAAVVTAAGADALCIQGSEAGAHRGSFSNDDLPAPALGLFTLLDEVPAASRLPLIAAGGIMGPTDVKAVLAAGAKAVQCGTAFLRAPESGAHPVYKAALADGRFTATALTRAFSGRPARGLVNGFIGRHKVAPAAYPEINNATRPLRSAAAAAGDDERMSLWAGTGYRAATERSAGEIVDFLCSKQTG